MLYLKTNILEQLPTMVIFLPIFIAGEVKTGLHGEEGCAVCKTVIQYVDSLLQENYTTELVEHTLLKVCNYMPESFKADVSHRTVAIKFYFRVWNSFADLRLFCLH